MDSGVHTSLLGTATAQSHQLELVAGQVLARALQVGDSTGRLLVSAMGPGAALSVLSTLAARNDCGSISPGSLAEWLPVAKTANTVRNRIIHTPWVVTQESGTIPDAVLAKGSMALETRSDDELRQDIEVMRRAVSSAIDLLSQDR